MDFEYLMTKRQTDNYVICPWLASLLLLILIRISLFPNSQTHAHFSNVDNNVGLHYYTTVFVVEFKFSLYLKFDTL